MRTTFLAAGFFLAWVSSAPAEETMLHKMLSAPPRQSAEIQAVRYTVPAVQPKRAVLPSVPIVVPPAGVHSRPLSVMQTPTATSCWDKVGFLRPFFTSGYAFFPMPTGMGFCGLQ